MIEFLNTLYSEWDKKIIYAPNGFGKTTNAIKLFNFYNKNGNNPLIFTRRQIENLVSTYGNIILFGDTSKNQKENLELEKAYATSLPLTSFFKKNYNTKEIRKLKDKSFYINKMSIKKLDAIDKIYDMDYIDSCYETQEETIETDKLINYDIYEKAIILLESDSFKQKRKISKNHILVDEDFIENFEYLQDFANSSENNNCPLCGKRFSSKEKLLEAIEKRRKKYKVKDPNDLYEELISLTKEIHNNYYESKIKEKLYNFDEQELLNPKGMQKLLSNYVKLCDYNCDCISKYIGDLKIDDRETIKTASKKHKSNKEKIENEKSNINNTKSFINFIIKELKKIISPNSEIEFKQVPNKISIQITNSNSTKPTDLYNILSESEIKRFTLVVLRAMIKYGSYEILILDDPIDSYDDYYMLVVCEYISKVIKETKLQHWYILTNNFTALSNLSNIIKCESKIYCYIPDDIFTTNDFKIDNFDVNYKEIETVSKNELILLNDYIKGKLNADSDLAYISFIPTLRNIKTVILQKYDRFFIKTGKAIKKGQYYADSSIEKDIKLIIERCYIHYDNNTSKINSNCLKVYEIADLYGRLSKLNAKAFKNYKCDKRSLCLLRKNIAHKQFNSLTGSKLLNFILIKICIVSYLKFEFEKLLICTLQSKYSFSQNDLDTIIETNSLGKKIEITKKLSKLNSYNAENFLNNYSDVYNSNKLLFNQFDHALEQMFPPYIATNVKDIKRFKDEIDNLYKELAANDSIDNKQLIPCV